MHRRQIFFLPWPGPCDCIVYTLHSLCFVNTLLGVLIVVDVQNTNLSETLFSLRVIYLLKQKLVVQVTFRRVCRCQKKKPPSVWKQESVFFKRQLLVLSLCHCVRQFGSTVPINAPWIGGNLYPRLQFPHTQK